MVSYVRKLCKLWYLGNCGIRFYSYFSNTTYHAI